MVISYSMSRSLKGSADTVHKSYMRTTKNTNLKLLISHLMHFSQPTYPHDLFFSGTSISHVELFMMLQPDWFSGGLSPAV